jgi:hypothetical protein
MSTSMGIVNGGLSLASTCWTAIDWKWVVDASVEDLKAHAPHRPLPALRFTRPDRMPRTILAKHPVDILLWDHSGDNPTDASTGGDPQVTSWLKLSDNHSRPSVIIEVWAASAALYPAGPLGKPTRKAFLSVGYSQRSFHANGTALGGAVSQARLVIVYFDTERIPLQVIRTWEPPAASTHAPRPMSNLLRPHGVPRQAYFHADRHRPITGTVPSSTTCSMPSTVNSWINTPRGIRKLLPDELAKGLGVPLEWMNSGQPLPARYLNHLVGTHIWETMGAAIEPVLANRPTPERATAPADALSQTLAAPADALSQTLVAPADALSQTLASPRTSTTGSTTSTTSAPADALSQTLVAPADALSQTLALPRTSTTSTSAPADALSQTL